MRLDAQGKMRLDAQGKIRGNEFKEKNIKIKCAALTN